jgi:exopolysaccharide biosynthesis polyprenyl glycosylphosphotransferase
MFGKRQEINLQISQLLDSLLIFLAFVITHGFRDSLNHWFPNLQEIPEFKEFTWLMAVLVPFTPLVLEAHGYYRNLLGKSLATSLRQLLQALLWMGLIIGACVVFFRWNPGSRLVLIFLTFAAGTLLLAKEIAIKRWLQKKSKSSRLRERVIMAGRPGDVSRFLESLNQDFSSEMEICAHFDLQEESLEKFIGIIRQYAVGRVIFAVDHVQFVKVEEAIRTCEIEGVEVCLVADFIRTSIAKPSLDSLGGRPVLVFRSTPDISWALTLKGLMDFIGAFLIILFSSPLWVIALIGIKLSSKGPIFFRQERSGRHGRVFRMYKFRTMYQDAEKRRQELEAANQMDGPVFKLENDPRIFSFGHFLRKYSIDELPQLLNVLRGEMSLVGPRPLPVYEVEKIEEAAKRRRMSVKPGLTCLWQISGRNQISSFEDWVKLDLAYIDNWSLLLDLRILLQTIPAVLSGKGAS